MKINLPITQVEEVFPSSYNILSTTDLKSRITYANADFIKVSGFELSELRGNHHNMVRHPDMPPAVFRMFWERIQANNSWMGIIKNRCKNGNYYWVDAYVTPVNEGGKTKEYQSVRRKPRQEDIARAERVYSRLNENKPIRRTRIHLAFHTKLLLTLILPLPLTLLLIYMLAPSSVGMMIGIGLGMLTTMALQHYVALPWRSLIKDIEQINSDPVECYIYTGRSDEIGKVRLALKTLEDETAGLIGRIADSAEHLGKSAAELSVVVTQSQKGVAQQGNQTAAVSTAIEQMQAAMGEITNHANETGVTVRENLETVEQGRTQEAVESIREVTETLLTKVSNQTLCFRRLKTTYI